MKEHVVESIEIGTAEAVPILADLVAVRSVNPKLPGADPADGEGEVAQYVADLLESHGINVTLQEVSPGRCNVIGHVSRSGRADNNVVLLCAHMDTYPSSTDQREYQPRIEGGFLFGRGSADAKGPLAAMLAATIRACRSPDKREFYIVASVDEEHGLCGCRALVTHQMRPDLAITGEPTSLIPIFGQKAVLRSVVRIGGHAAHAAYPSGENCLFTTAAVLTALNSFNRALSKASSPMGEFGVATVTPVKVETDGEMNKTPSEVRVFFDARLPPGESAAAFLDRLSAYLTDQISGEVAVENPYFESPSNLCETSDLLVSEFFSHVAKTTGGCEPSTFAYGSEAGVLASIGRCCLVFGPGDPKYSHGPGECISLQELAKAETIFFDLLTASH